MNDYGVSNIRILGYTGEEIKKIYEVARDKHYNEFINKKRKELALSLGLSPECLNSECSNYPRLKAESVLYNKHGYRVLRSNIVGPIKQPKFNLKIIKL